MFINHIDDLTKIFKDWSKFYINSKNTKFTIFEIQYQPDYKRKFIKENFINFLNIQEMTKDFNLNQNIEYAMFSKDKNITYDNKQSGGKILINISNQYISNDNKLFNFSNVLFPLNNKNISIPMKMFYTLSFLLMIKNIILENSKFTFNTNDDFIQLLLSYEGVSIIKDRNYTKINISLDKDFDLEKIKFFCKFLKIILIINNEFSFKFNYYKNIKESHIIK